MSESESSDISALYARARLRWAAVPWPIEAYRTHLGDERPPWAVDLYLGGAAGWRLDEAWTTVESDIGPDVRRVLARQPIADMTVEDLWSETLVRMMADDPKRAALPDGRTPARIIRYRGLVKLTNYLITVGRRVAIQRNRRPAARMLSLNAASDGDARRPVAADAPGPEQVSEDGETLARLHAALREAFAALSPERQFLLAMVYRQGMTRRAAGELLGWSPFKTTRQMQVAVGALQKAFRRAAVTWTDAVASAWSGAWEGCWNTMQECSAPASEMLTEGANDHE